MALGPLPHEGVDQPSHLTGDPRLHRAQWSHDRVDVYVTAFGAKERSRSPEPELWIGLRAEVDAGPRVRPEARTVLAQIGVTS